MTREAYDDFLSKLHAAGLKSYSMIVMGGNITIVHEDPEEVSKPTGYIIDKGDYVISLQRSRDYMSASGKFDVYYYPLDMCDAVFARNLTFNEFKDMVGLDEEITAWIKNVPIKRNLNPEATPTIGQDNPVEGAVLAQYTKQDTVLSGNEPEDPKYHTIKHIEELPKTDDEVSTIPPRKEESESDEG